MGYDRQINTALSLISRYGKEVLYKSVVETKDALKPWMVSSESVVEYSPSVVFLPLSNAKTYTGKDGLALDKVNYMCIMGNNDFDVKIGDYFIDGNREYHIVMVDVLAPDNKPILYTLFLRG
jgi:hypothetical protein